MASEIKVDTIVNAGGDNDTGIDLATNDNIKFNIAGSQKAIIESNGRLGIGTSSPSVPLHVVSSTTQTNDSTPALTVETQGHAQIRLNGDGNEFAIMALDSSVAGDHFIIYDKNNSAERVRLTSTGDLLIGKTSTSSTVSGIHIGTEKLTATRSGGPCGAFVRTGSDGSVVDIQNDSSTVGSISVSGSSTAYNTSSDYRLKENVVTDWDATSRLKQLKPSRFNFIADADTTVDGFLAHEAQSVVPEAVVGEKDAVDKEGNIQPQGIDQSKLVPLLTKALQEAMARIETLEAKVTALESK